MSDRRIAITGMACLFPGSNSLAQYWDNILAARVLTGPIPDDHSWSVEDMYDADPSAPDKTYARTGGFLDKTPFDPMQFGLTPNALDATDTSQLLSLIVAREALRDAGVDPDGTDWNRDRTACIMGVTGTQEMAISQGARLYGPIWRKAMLRMGLDPALADDIVDDIKAHFPEWQEQTFPGLLGNVVTGRVANRLDLGGTNCVTDAACASSTAALRMAMDDLLAGRSDLALSGGADTINDIFMYMCFSKTPAMSTAGQARPFDAAADGTLIAEGISMLALKRLDDAERDGDRIYAVIDGMGSSSDGRAKSIYAPHAPGQVKAMRRAYEDAGYGPETVELIEAHGTGTRAGDATEVAGLKTVFADTPAGHRVALGSVKSQIGHTKSTAGAAGLMKAALALYTKVLPPTAGIDTPNPKMELDEGALYVNTVARPWVRSADHVRRAGVSAFGFGGTNFHVLLSEHGDEVVTTGPAAGELFLFGADSAAALKAKLVAPSGPTFSHIAREVHQSWTPSAHVVGFVASDASELQAKLGIAAELVSKGAGSKDDVFYGIPDEHSRRVALLFPGQGSQYVNMGRSAALRHPALRRVLDRAEDHFRTKEAGSLAARIYPNPAFDKATEKQQQADLTATEWAQPAIGVISKGYLDVLAQFGVQAEAFAGHSYGELVALCAAGALSEADLFEASRVRGLAMADKGTDRGTMAAVGGDLARIDEVLATLNDGVVLANRNHPRQGVISGSREGVARAMEALSAADLTPQPIPVSAAFHSPLVADAASPLSDCLGALDVQAPSGTVYSNVSAEPYAADADAVRQGLVDQVTSTVRFVDIVQDMADQGIRTFVECGPKRVLSGLVRKTLRRTPNVAAYATNPEGERKDGDVQLKELLAVLATRGVPVDLAPLLAERLPEPPKQAGSKATVWLGGANYRRPETKNPPAPKKRRVAVAAPAASTPAPATASAGRGVRGQGSGVRGAAAGGAGVAVAAGASGASAAKVSLGAGSLGLSVATSPSATGSVGSGGSAMNNSSLAELLAATRETLAAFQSTQAETAKVHSAFLEGQASAHRSFERLFDTHARLVEAAATGQLPAARPVTAAALSTPTPAPAATSAMAAPAAAAVDSSFLNSGAPAPSAPTPTLSRGAEAHAGGGRVAMHDYARPEVAADDDVPLILTATGLDGGTTAVGQRGAPAPAVTSTPAVAAPAVDVDGAMLSAIADKTGYPADMLEPGMDLESDLGIDSIKRVEILAAVQEAVPSLPELDNERMSALRTISEVTGYLRELLPAGGAAPVVASAPAVDVDGAMYAAIADKTGYPADMLEPSMDLESDLGIDSIKRVEILAAVQEAVPSLPELDNERMSALRTISEVTGYLRELLPAGGPAPVVASAPAVDVDGAMYAAIADKTGYPADMLEPGMDLESDLGIDSIKRVEILAAVQEAVPSLPELDNERMSALRTISEVTGYLRELLPSAAAPAPVAAAPAVDVDGAMYAAIADKTGYPADMLEPGMDLESDLGIDSIKRVEILAAVQTAVPSLPELDNERMSALRTISEVTGYLRELLPTGAAAAAPAPTPTAEPVQSESNEPLRRRVVELVPAPAGQPVSLDAVALSGPAEAVAALTSALSQRGVAVRDDADTLVVLDAVGTSGDALDAAALRAFHLARERGPLNFVTVTDQDGAHGHGTGSERNVAGALAGLVKTLSHEWTEQRLLALDVDTFDADAIASELLTNRGVVELGLRGGEALAVTVRDLPLNEELGTDPVQPDDLVVVSGGARGVTAAVVLEMARRWRPSLLLIGRSALPVTDPDWALGVADDKLQAARIGAARAAGEKITPKQASNDVWRVLSAREVRHNLAAIEATGASVRYASADIRDAAAVKQAVAASVREHGPVRGLVHGAGVIADKLAVEKTDDAFDRVYGTKIDGWRNLLAASEAGELSFVATFGSVAGRFGNLGQCDYAMANEVLSRSALTLNRQGVRARCFAWGPWEAGMVTPALRKQLAARGMSMIPLDDGASFFCDDLERGTHVEVVVGGPDGGSLLGPDSPRTSSTSQAMSKTLQPSSRFLANHRINGKPVLPAVMVLEWMASAATANHPGLRFAGVRDFAVLKGVVVDSDRAELSLEWSEVAPKAGASKALAFRLLGATGPLGQPIVHYTGTVDLAAQPGTPARFAGSNGLGKQRYPHELGEAYRNFLFHGPELRGIHEIVGMSDHGIVAKLGTSAPSDLDGEGKTWATDPLTLDSLLQTMVLWVRESTGSAALPCYMGDYQQFAPLDGELTVHLTMHPTKTARGSFDATLVNEAGDVVATLTKGEYAANPSMNAAFRAEA